MTTKTLELPRIDGKLIRRVDYNPYDLMADPKVVWDIVLSGNDYFATYSTKRAAIIDAKHYNIRLVNLK